MVDTHTFFISLYCFAWSAAAVDVGAQEQEIPGVIYDVAFPVDQEYLGGSQAGGLAFSIVLCLC